MGLEGRSPVARTELEKDLQISPAPPKATKVINLGLPQEKGTIT